MTSANRSYPDWKAPKEDGEILLWPNVSDLSQQTHENHARLAEASTTLVQNVPLPEIRQRIRAYIGHATDVPLIVTGHQTELHHPGVWVKNIVIDALAKKLNGRAVHVAVDTDEPKHLNLRWPGASQPISDDPALRNGAWSALVAPPTPTHLASLGSRVEQVSSTWSFTPAITAVFDSLQKLLLEAESLPGCLTNALHQLDWSLDVKYDALLASPIWMSEPFLVFAHHIMGHGAGFASDYNASLADYRTAAGIKSTGRPMPDLKLIGDVCESPFWLDDLSTGKRVRASVANTGDVWALEYQGDAFIFDRKQDGWDSAKNLQRFLRRHNLRLSPRALMLTMFLRLFVADQFVHGIGGARYDQVTDRLIAKHFQLTPPHFSVATATLYFPDAVGRSRACLPCVLQEGRRLRHDLIGERKMQFVRQIEQSPRNSFERHEIFAQMHRELASAAFASPVLADWEQRKHQSELDFRNDEMLFDRELFYALQPRTRLASLIEKVRQSI